MTLSTFWKDLSKFARRDDACRWGIGDLLLKAWLDEVINPELYPEISRQTSWTIAELNAMREVSKAFEPSKRLSSLPWAFHHVVHLETHLGRRAALLRKAEREQMTLADFRLLVKGTEVPDDARTTTTFTCIMPADEGHEIKALMVRRRISQSAACAEALRAWAKLAKVKTA